MTSWNQEQGVRREGNTLVLVEEPIYGVQPASTEDVGRYLQDPQVTTVDLGSAWEKNVMPVTWHS